MRPTLEDFGCGARQSFWYDCNHVVLHAEWKTLIKRIECEVKYIDRIFTDKKTLQFEEGMTIGQICEVGLSQFWTAYIILPNAVFDEIGYPKDRREYMDYDVDLSVPNGITYSLQLDEKNVKIGWDYQHLGNKQTGKKETYSSIIKDIETVIDRIAELSPTVKNFLDFWEEKQK